MNVNGAFTQELDDFVQQILPSLVVVRGHRYGAGAGIIWDADGLILTNNHVVGKYLPKVVLQDDREFESQLVARDPDHDLALLKINASGLTPLKPASVSTRVGEMAFAFGHPWGQRNMVTRGIVSALTSARTRKDERLPIIRSDVPLAPGNSGGPLVNARGEVIGINAMIVGGDQSVSIAVSVARDFVHNVLKEQKPQPNEKEAIPEGVI